MEIVIAVLLPPLGVFLATVTAFPFVVVGPNSVFKLMHVSCRKPTTSVSEACDALTISRRCASPDHRVRLPFAHVANSATLHTHAATKTLIAAAGLLDRLLDQHPPHSSVSSFADFGSLLGSSACLEHEAYATLLSTAQDFRSLRKLAKLTMLAASTMQGLHSGHHPRHLHHWRASAGKPWNMICEELVGGIRFTSGKVAST